jgi:hypothetical protein
MQLAELSAAERRFLTSPFAPTEKLSALLVEHLSQVLSARMKRSVQVQADTCTAQNGVAVLLGDTDVAEFNHAPKMSWDKALDALWLRGRLGGRSGFSGEPCAVMLKSLQRTLQLALAETWISLPATKALPAVLSLRIQTSGNKTHLDKPCAEKIATEQALLVIRFPPALASMNQWAQTIISSCE